MKFSRWIGIVTGGFLACGPAQAETAGKSCVLREHVAAPVVRDDGRLYFRGQPDRRQSYIALFKGEACHKLNPFATAVVETSGAGYCEGDQVRFLILPSRIPGPICVIDHLAPFGGDVDDPIPENWRDK
ncbi:hypothetical protein DM806_19740 [Sphingobium lactosutens]|uniref:hypothetical protein n=1 Tax=Sphingobium lactosutens TaxID=522773 RepID=UPI0015BEF42C|nr:hypothetical protein [Sphingobium lactosutens]NWK97846.1 hypothetical protein [Sphingobium lactosutens]